MKNVIAIGVLSVILFGCVSGTPILKLDRTPEKRINRTLIQSQGGNPMMLKQDELFDKLSIDVPAGAKEQYIYSDHIAGYFEGYTHTYKKAGGYMMGQAGFYQDFGTFCGETLNNKNKAKLTKIYPYGVRTIYSDGVWDEFILHTGIYAISLVLHSDKADVLKFVPMINLPKSTIIENYGNVVSFSPKRPNSSSTSPQFVAIACDKPFVYSDGDVEAQPTLKKDLKFIKTSLIPVFASAKPTNDMTMHIAFGMTKDEAIDKALEMVSTPQIELHKSQVYDFLTRTYLWTDDLEYNRALMWNKFGAYAMVVTEFGKGIWAGLPWFKQNWGRDTFISLPGTLIVTGMFDEAKAVMTNFSTFQNRGRMLLSAKYEESAKEKVKAYLKDNFGKKITFQPGVMTVILDRVYLDKPELLKTKIEEMKKAIAGVDVSYVLETDKDYGRIPNRVASLDNIIYNTTDGSPWFIREVYEYLRYTGDIAFAKDIYPVVQLAIEGALSNYVDANGFLTHDDADTWMDARINGGLPWSARGNRANDIQTLWYTALRVGAYLANYTGDKDFARKCTEIADRLKASFPKYFWDDKNKILADRVAKDDTADYKIRPNQLMTISIPFEDRFVDDITGAYIVKNAISELLYPYGIATLSQNDPYFHPYHDNQPMYNKDAAYHNGTVWGWNAGFTVSAMVRYGYIDLAYTMETNLGYQTLYLGCRGNMSELVDAIWSEDHKLKLSGTYAQAWSTAEYSRNGYQDFAGFRPNMLENLIEFAPSIPTKWTTFEAGFSFDKKGQLAVSYKRDGSKDVYTIQTVGYEKALKLRFMPESKKTRYAAEITLEPGKKITVEFDRATAKVKADDKELKVKITLESAESIIGDLKFQTPKISPDYPALKTKDYLKQIVESGNYK